MARAITKCLFMEGMSPQGGFSCQRFNSVATGQEMVGKN